MNVHKRMKPWLQLPMVLVMGCFAIAQTCPGDVNVDAVRDVQDVVGILRHVNGSQPLQGTGLTNADVDGSGIVNTQDAGRLRNHLIGLQPLAGCAPGTDPRIVSLTPPRGISETMVVIEGANFGATAGANTVRFDTDTAVIQSASPTRLTVASPTTAGGGFVRNVTVTTGGRTSNAKPFIVDRFLPTARVEPLSLLAGSAPPFSLSISLNSGNLVAQRVRISFSNVTLNTGGLGVDSVLGRGYVSINLGLFGTLTHHGIFLIDRVQGSRFDVLIRGTDGNQTGDLVTGQMIPGANGFDLDLVFELPSQFAANARDTEQALTFSNTMLLHIDPRLISLPQSPGATVTINTAFTSETPPGGGRLARNVTDRYTTLVPAAGAAVVRELAPFDPSHRQEVVLRGAGFSATAAENIVTFTKADGTRQTAPVLAATPTSLTVNVPSDVVTGPVRVERVGLPSNDHQVWMAFSPSVDLTLTTPAANTATGLTLTLRELGQQLTTQSLLTQLDRGNWNYGTMPVGTRIGRMTGRVGIVPTALDIFVGATDGNSYADLIFRDSDGDRFDATRMILSNRPSGGVLLQFVVVDRDVSQASIFSFSASSATMSFDAAVLNTPSSGPITCTTWLTSSPQVPGGIRPLRAASIGTVNIP